MTSAFLVLFTTAIVVVGIMLRKRKALLYFVIASWLAIYRKKMGLNYA